jgi:hypothetical protein
MKHISLRSVSKPALSLSKEGGVDVIASGVTPGESPQIILKPWDAKTTH